MTRQTYGALCALAEQHGVKMTEEVRALLRAVEAADAASVRGELVTDEHRAALMFFLKMTEAVPVCDVLKATRTVGTLIDYFKGLAECRRMAPYGSVHAGAEMQAESPQSQAAQGNTVVLGVADKGRVVVDRYMVCGLASVQRVRQMRGPDMWKVEKSGENLNKQGEWEHEPLPSARDDAFLERSRFSSAEAAIAAAMRVVAEVGGAA